MTLSKTDLDRLEAAFVLVAEGQGRSTQDIDVLVEERYQAQQEILPTLLVELTQTNRRVDDLEQAS
ncbi:MAG: hypothetical protein WBB01_24655 [Phormidesmis sp.]